MKKLIVLFISLFVFIPSVTAASNPYGKYQTLYGIKTIRCTWYAWDQAYKYTGVALPGWGNAQTWYNSAINAGYKVGSEARANSIAVWSSSDGYGHVGFVVSVDGNIMTINEAGIVTEENEGVVNGSKQYTTADNLIGFIYLEEAPSSNNSNKNNTSNNNASNNTSNNTSNKKEEKSSNNNLSSLTIDELEDFSFDKDKTEYTLEVDYETQIINISAIPESSDAVVEGTGAKALKVGENTYSIIVTAEDGTTKEYKITINRREEEVSGTVNVPEEEVIVEFNFKKYLYAGLICGGIVLAIILLILFIVRKKRKKA